MHYLDLVNTIVKESQYYYSIQILFFLNVTLKRKSN